MSLRLLLAVMLALMGLPCAGTACADVPPAAAAQIVAHHHGSHERQQPGSDSAAMMHACLGCIPPDTLRGTDIAALAPMPTLPRAVRAELIAVGRAWPPALPPPRHR